MYLGTKFVSIREEFLALKCALWCFAVTNLMIIGLSTSESLKTEFKPVFSIQNYIFRICVCVWEIINGYCSIEKNGFKWGF